MRRPLPYVPRATALVVFPQTGDLRPLMYRRVQRACRDNCTRFGGTLKSSFSAFSKFRRAAFARDDHQTGCCTRVLVRRRQQLLPILCGRANYPQRPTMSSAIVWIEYVSMVRRTGTRRDRGSIMFSACTVQRTAPLASPSSGN